MPRDPINTKFKVIAQASGISLDLVQSYLQGEKVGKALNAGQKDLISDLNDSYRSTHAQGFLRLN